MSNSDETAPGLPEGLLIAFREARIAIAQQKYAEALSGLEQGLDRKYDPTAIDTLELLAHLRGLVFILEFNLRQAHGLDWPQKVKKVPDNETRCLFCGKTYADVATLISGPEGIICNECVGICNEILANE